MYFIENDIRNLLPERDVNILLEKTDDQDGLSFLLQRSLFAIDFVKSKIQHRYDPGQIFIDVNEFDISATYQVGSLIYYTEQEYDDAATYNVGDRVSYQNHIYEQTDTAPVTGVLPTDTNSWTQRVRDKQYYNTDAISNGNYPEDTSYFTPGDTRHQLILTYTFTLAAYELFKKVQPNMVPEWIVQSRDEVVEHLDRIADAKDTVDLPLYLDDEGEPDNERGQEIT